MCEREREKKKLLIVVVDHRREGGTSVGVNLLGGRSSLGSLVVIRGLATWEHADVFLSVNVSSVATSQAPVTIHCDHSLRRANVTEDFIRGASGDGEERKGEGTREKKGVEKKDVGGRKGGAEQKKKAKK